MVGGVVTGARHTKSKSGNRICIFQLEDDAASLEVCVWGNVYEKIGHLAQNDAAVVVRGRYEKDEETGKIIAADIKPIAVVRAQATREVAVRLAAPQHGRPVFEQLMDVLARHRGDRRVTLELRVPAAATRGLLVRADAPLRVKPSERLVSDVERLCGAGSIELR
jgi:DNA polymerase-3 subunit alpha